MKRKVLCAGELEKMLKVEGLPRRGSWPWFVAVVRVSRTTKINRLHVVSEARE